MRSLGRCDICQKVWLSSQGVKRMRKACQMIERYNGHGGGCDN